MTDDLATLATLLAEPGQPDPVFKAFEQITKRLVGHELFTDGVRYAVEQLHRPLGHAGRTHCLQRDLGEQSCRARM